MRLEDGIWKQAALINSLKLICSLEMDQFNDLTSVIAYFAAFSQSLFLLSWVALKKCRKTLSPDATEEEKAAQKWMSRE